MKKLTLKEFASMRNLTYSQVYYRIRKGYIPHIRVNGHIYIPYPDLEDYEKILLYWVKISPLVKLGFVPLNILAKELNNLLRKCGFVELTEEEHLKFINELRAKYPVLNIVKYYNQYLGKIETSIKVGVLADIANQLNIDLPKVR